MPMGKNSAPAIKKPHMSAAKQVKICVSHAKKQTATIVKPTVDSITSPYLSIDSIVSTLSPVVLCIRRMIPAVTLVLPLRMRLTDGAVISKALASDASFRKSHSVIKKSKSLCGYNRALIVVRMEFGHHHSLQRVRLLAERHALSSTPGSV